MLAGGAGSESRTTLGVVIFFGVAIATVLTLFVIPMYYSLIARRSTTPAGDREEAGGDGGRQIEALTDWRRQPQERISLLAPGELL